MNERQQCQNWNAAADWSMKDGFGPFTSIYLDELQHNIGALKQSLLDHHIPAEIKRVTILDHGAGH